MSEFSSLTCRLDAAAKEQPVVIAVLEAQPARDRYLGERAEQIAALVEEAKRHDCYAHGVGSGPPWARGVECRMCAALEALEPPGGDRG